MEVNTGQFAAITAETGMLREHAARQAPGRHRRPRPQRRPGEHADPERGMDRWWRGGYARAMQEVLVVIHEAEKTAGPGAGCGVALEAVYAVAASVVTLHACDTMPASWTADGDGR